MPDVVDPTAIIRARLDELVAEHEPRINDLVQALATASKSQRRQVSAELRAAKRDYARARSEVSALGGPGTAW